MSDAFDDSEMWGCKITPIIDGEVRRFVHDLTATITIPVLPASTTRAVGVVVLNGQRFHRALPPDFRATDFRVPDEIAALFPGEKDEGT